VHHSQVVKVPTDIDLTAASLLACGVITGIGAVVNAAEMKTGQSVIVIGAGGVGLNAIQGARIAGARRIVAVDMSEEKLAMARDFGATDGVLATDPKPWRAAKAALGGGADIVVVSVGAIPAYDQAPRYIYGRSIDLRTREFRRCRTSHDRLENGRCRHRAGHPMDDRALRTRPAETGRVGLKDMAARSDQRSHRGHQNRRSQAQRHCILASVMHHFAKITQTPTPK